MVILDLQGFLDLYFPGYVGSIDYGGFLPFDGAMGSPGMIRNCRTLEILFATVISMLLESRFQLPRGLTDVGFPAGTRYPVHHPQL